MAAVITLVNDYGLNRPDNSPIRVKKAVLTFDDSYPSGGEVITLSEIGFEYIYGAVCIAGCGGYTFELVPSTHAMKVYWVDTTTDGAPQAEVTATTNLSTLAPTFLFFGV